ncbi:MAG TPA: hypothetical protein VK465_06300 [Fibrobacteria bacterium]|nr:hypothetical protein [Fibrobacteria bacterium]
MREIPGYIVSETLWEGKELVLQRGKRQADQSRVLLESPVSPDGAHARERIEREYSLQAELDPSWTLAPAGRERVQDRLSLVFEDPGGDLLSRRLHEPRSLADGLKLAIGLCSALGKLHARGLVHKDLQPAHVWVDASGAVHLMGKTGARSHRCGEVGTFSQAVTPRDSIPPSDSPEGHTAADRRGLSIR